MTKDFVEPNEKNLVPSERQEEAPQEEEKTESLDHQLDIPFDAEDDRKTNEPEVRIVLDEARELPRRGQTESVIRMFAESVNEDNEILIKEPSPNECIWRPFPDARPVVGTPYWKDLPPFDRNRVSVAVLICMYNEDEHAVLTSWNSVVNNLQYSQIKRQHVDLHLLLVQDGWTRAHQTTKDLLGTAFGFEFEPTLEASIAQERVETFVVHRSNHHCVMNNSCLRATFVTKTNNRKKFNSHEWFLAEGGFVDVLRPDYFLLTDCGSEFCMESLHALVEHMEENPTTGGATGRPRILTRYHDGSDLSYFSRAGWYRKAQMYEMEESSAAYLAAFSLVGFLRVIPGPCGFYRTGSMLGDPIKWYIQTVTDETKEFGLIFGNLRNAEDAFLGFCCCMKSTYASTTRLIPGCIWSYEAETDLESLAKQRRRWINGSISGALYLFLHSTHLIRADVPKARLLFVFVMFGIQLIIYLLAAISPTIFAFAARAGLDSFAPSPVPEICWAYFMILYVVFTVSHAFERWTYIPWLFQTASITGIPFMVFTIIGIVNIFSELINDFDAQSVVVCLLIGIPIIPLINALILSPKSFMIMMLCLVRYVLFMPTNTMWFTSYAIARSWDLSWGNRPGDSEQTVSEKRKVKYYGWLVCGIVVVTNIVLALSLNFLVPDDRIGDIVFILLCPTVALYLLFLGSSIYYIKYQSKRLWKFLRGYII